MNAPARSALGAGLVVITESDLRNIIREELEADREERARAVSPAHLLVSPTEMAGLIGVSRTTLHRLRRSGAPAVKIGDVYKYEPPAVLAWLKSREVDS